MNRQDKAALMERRKKWGMETPRTNRPMKEGLLALLDGNKAESLNDARALLEADRDNLGPMGEWLLAELEKRTKGKP